MAKYASVLFKSLFATLMGRVSGSDFSIESDSDHLQVGAGGIGEACAYNS